MTRLANGLRALHLPEENRWATDLPILVVADGAIARMLAVKAVQAYGCRAVEVSDSSIAVELYERLQPRGVFLDVTHAGTTGLKLVQALRTQDPHARIAMATTRADRAFVRRALQAGICDLVVKPVAAPRLAQLVSTLIAPPTERQQPRFAVTLRGEILVGEEQEALQPCIVEDMSLSGARCILESRAPAQPIAPGMIVHLKVLLPDHAAPIQALGRVARVVSPGVVGLSLVHMSEEHSEWLATFCRREGRLLQGTVAARQGERRGAEV